MHPKLITVLLSFNKIIFLDDEENNVILLPIN